MRDLTTIMFDNAPADVRRKVYDAVDAGKRVDFTVLPADHSDNTTGSARLVITIDGDEVLSW